MVSVPNHYSVGAESYASCAPSKGQVLKYIFAYECSSKPVASYQHAFMGTGSEVKTSLHTSVLEWANRRNMQIGCSLLLSVLRRYTQVAACFTQGSGINPKIRKEDGLL